MRPLFLEQAGAVVRVTDIRADYIVEGRRCLGWVSLSRGPLAFMTQVDRAALLHIDSDYFTRLHDCLPPAMTLAQAGAAVKALEAK